MTAVPTSPAGTAGSSTRGRAPRAPGRRRRHWPGPLVCVCIAVLAVVAFCAAFGWLVEPFGPNSQDLLVGLAGPSGAHPFGTDDLGRDILSRVIDGARPALLGPLAVAVGTAVLGGVLGLVSGYAGGWVDAIIMRWADLMYAMPGLLVLIVVGGVLGGGYAVAVPLLILFFAPYTARIVRSVTLEQQGRAYMEAARVLGISRWRRILVHLAPNAMPEVVATTCVQFATSLVTLSSLSFLGLGAAAGSADWGLMAAANRTLILDNPLSMLAPAAMIVITAAAVTIVGDWAFERMQNRGRSS